jgi:Zn-dependent peptidase ImmA (M78 family)
MEKINHYQISMDDQDPQLIEIEQSFLSYVEEQHRKYSYNPDFYSLAKSLDLTLKKTNLDIDGLIQSFGDQKIALISENQPQSRFKFTAWHEISHHLFDLAEGGDLKAFLRDQLPNQKHATEFEEQLCDKSAAILLMPTPIYSAIYERHGYSPLCIFELAERTGASLQAAMRRLVYANKIEVNCILFRADGYVIDSVDLHIGRSYASGCDYSLSQTHPLITANYKPLKEERFTALVPFKNSNVQWKKKVLAAANCNGERVIAFFLENYPTPPTVDQLTLDFFNK